MSQCECTTLKGKRCKCIALPNCKMCRIHSSQLKRRDSGKKSNTISREGMCQYIGGDGKKCWNLMIKNSKYCENCLEKIKNIDIFIHPNMKYINIDKQPTLNLLSCRSKYLLQYPPQIKFNSFFKNAKRCVTVSFNNETLEFFGEDGVYFSNQINLNEFYIIENCDDKSFLYFYDKSTFKGSLLNFNKKIGPLETYFDGKLYDYFRVYHPPSNGWRDIVYYRNRMPVIVNIFNETSDKILYGDGSNFYFYDCPNSPKSLNIYSIENYFCVRDGKIYQCCSKSGMVLAVYFSDSQIDSFDIATRMSCGCVIEAKTKGDEVVGGIISTYEFTPSDVMLNDLFKEKMKLENVCMWLGECHPSHIIRNILIEETLRLYRIKFSRV